MLHLKTTIKILLAVALILSVGLAVVGEEKVVGPTTTKAKVKSLQAPAQDAVLQAKIESSFSLSTDEDAAVAAEKEAYDQAKAAGRSTSLTDNVEIDPVRPLENVSFISAGKLNYAEPKDNHVSQSERDAMFAQKAPSTYSAVNSSKISSTVFGGQQSGSSSSSKAFFLNEDFEGGIMPPTDWSVIDGSLSAEHWGVSTTNVPFGAYKAHVAYDYDQDEWLISPSVDLTAITTGVAELSFWFNMSYYWGQDPYDNYDVNVLISTNGGTSWTQLWTEADFDDGQGNAAPWETDVWYEVILDISSYLTETDVMFAFQYLGNDGAWASIDRIRVGDGTDPGGRCCYYSGMTLSCLADPTMTEDLCFNTFGGFDWIEDGDCAVDICEEQPFGRCCYGNVNAPSCADEFEFQCLARLDAVSFTEGIDCTEACPVVPIPDNNEITGAIDITGTYPVEVDGSTYGANWDNGCAVLDGAYVCVFYKFDAPYAVNTVTQDFCGTDGDIGNYLIIFLNDEGCAAYTFNDEGDFYDCGDGHSNPSQTFTLAGPATYYIPVYTGNYGEKAPQDFHFSLDVVEATTIENDNCADATPIGEGTFAGTTIGATLDGNYYSGDVWYLYTATCTGDATISLCSSPNAGWDAVIDVWEDCTFASEVAYNDDFCGVLPEVTFAVTTGTSYLIEIGSWSAAGEDDFEMVITNDGCGATPANDIVTNAELVNGPYPQVVNGTSIGATEDCVGQFTEPSYWVWYQVDIAGTGDYEITLDYCGTDPQTNTVSILMYPMPFDEGTNCGDYVYPDCIADGSCTSWDDVTHDCGFGDPQPNLLWTVEGPGSFLFPVECGYDDGSKAQVPIDFQITFTVEEWTPPTGRCCVYDVAGDFDYCVPDIYQADCAALDGMWGEGLDCVDCPPTSGFENDDCEFATDITGTYPVSVTGTTYGANPDCVGTQDWLGVWYKFDLPYAVNNVSIDYCGTLADLGAGINAVLQTECSCETSSFIYYSSGGFADCGDGVDVPTIYWNNIEGPTTLWYIVSGEAAKADTPFDFEIELDVQPVVAPPNDDCADAIAIGEVTDMPFSTVGATPDAGGYSASPSIWYSYTATCNGTVTVDLCSTVYGSGDSKAAAWESCISNMLGGDDDVCGSPAYQAWFEFPCITGETYYIEIGGYSDYSEGDGLLTLSVACGVDWGVCCYGDMTAPTCADVANIGECDALGGNFTMGEECATFSCPVVYPGENCANPITAKLPDDMNDGPANEQYIDVNSTCGMVDDYEDTDLGYYDGGEDIIYQFDVSGPLTVDITLDPGTNTWTGFGIFTDCPDQVGTMVAYATYSTMSYSNPIVLTNVTLETGFYYLMADSWPSPECYPFTLTISPPCEYTCEGGTPEGEACGDESNDGCNVDPPSFGSISCGETICGNFWADEGSRDTDWYIFHLDGWYDVTLTANAGGGYLAGFILSDDPGAVGCDLFPGSFDVSMTGAGCTENSITATYGPGSYAIFMGSDDFYDFPCPGVDYSLTLDCVAIDGPAISVTPSDPIDFGAHIVNTGAMGSTTLTIANDGPGGADLNFDVFIDYGVGKEIDGAYMYCNDQYVPGITKDIDVYVQNASSDAEWLDSLAITWPTGVTCNTATDFVVTTNATHYCNYKGTVGQVSDWGNWNDGYGNIYSTELAMATINLTFDASFADDLVVDYHISGDDYGSTPHDVFGTFEILWSDPTVSWLYTNISGGSIPYGGAPIDVEVGFITTDLPVGVYEATIIIAHNSKAGNNGIPILIPVTLEILPTFIFGPDPCYAYMKNATDPITADMHFGDLAVGGDINTVTNVVLTVEGTAVTISTPTVAGGGFGYLTGDIMEFTFPVRDFILAEEAADGEIWEETAADIVVSYDLGGTPESFEGKVMIFGHIAGDLNKDREVNISDLVMMVNFMFKGGPAPEIMASMDVNGSGGPADVSDLVHFVNYMFKGGPAPTHP